MYYYIRSEPGLWTVGCEHDGRWQPDSDYNDREKAAHRVAYLNGNCAEEIAQIRQRIEHLEKLVFARS